MRRALAALALLLVASGPPPGWGQSRPRLPGAAPPRGPAPTEAPGPAGPAAPANETRLVVGALLPLTGPAAWYGEEMRRGLELALAQVNPPPPRPAPAAARPGGSARRAAGADGDPGQATRPGDEAPAAPGPEAPEAGEGPGDATAGGEQGGRTRGGTPGAAGRAPAREGAEPGGDPKASRPAVVRLVLQVEDVDPLDPKSTAAAVGRLLAAGAAVVFTASPTPTLAVHAQASGRDVLIVHQGFRSERLPAPSRGLFHTRPSPAALGEAAVAYLRRRGVQRVALLAPGDEFGRAVRAAVGTAWRRDGASLLYDASLSLDSPDAGAHLRRLAAVSPDVVLLAFRGEELGEVAARLRETGIQAYLMGLDDDPVVALAAGPAVADFLLVSDAFVGEGAAAGESFAEGYASKHGRAPSRFAANAYEALLALGRAAAAVVPRGNPRGTRLRDALVGAAPAPSVYGGPAGFRDDGTFTRPLALSTVERGRIHFVRYLEADGPAAPASP